MAESPQSATGRYILLWEREDGATRIWDWPNEYEGADDLNQAKLALNEYAASHPRNTYVLAKIVDIRLSQRP
jgi:hypothetical protein